MVLNFERKKFLLFLLGVFVVFFAVACTESGPSKSYDTFAKCLTENGVRMYGTEWCSHCQNQKKAFGESFDYIDFIDCDQSPGLCEMQGVRGYPTWAINGENYAGEQPLEKLGNLAGCEFIPDSPVEAGVNN